MQWIKCSERMPEHQEEVLIIETSKMFSKITIAKTCCDEKNPTWRLQDNWVIENKVTHWMPLPPEPKE